MKNLVMFVLLFFGVVSWVNGNSTTTTVKEGLKGTWEFKVPEAPYEYNAGKIIFGEVDGKPTVTVKLKSGTEIKAQDVKLENDSISFGVMIEYELVKVTGKLAENKITGKASSSQGIMNITAEKPVTKTN
ncbi:MAG: hypothetical protein AB2L24_06765 [Mangrovibacterium sp.]